MSDTPMFDPLTGLYFGPHTPWWRRVLSWLRQSLGSETKGG